jgi:site-specific recombinase XerD
VVALELDDISITERKGQVIVRQGKGLKERVVPLSRMARAATSEYLAERLSVNAKNGMVQNQAIAPLQLNEQKSNLKQAKHFN